MSLPLPLCNVRDYPGMYLSKIEFSEAAALINGYAIAHHGRFLDGFREWLIVKLNDGNNLTWSSLVLRLIFPESDIPSVQLNHTNQEQAVRSLFQILDEFCTLKETPDGLRQIFLQYQDWLQHQDWYNPASH